MAVESSRGVGPVLACIATLLMAASAVADAPADARLITSIQESTIELEVPSSALILSFPRSGLTPVDEERKRAQTSPRYFHLSAESGLVVSGWVESESRFPGFHRFWDGEFAALQRSKFPPSGPPTLSQSGLWSIAAYDVDMQRGAAGPRSAHLRAELVKDGTWVDLPISVTSSSETLAEARARALQFLSSIQVRTKGKAPAGT